MCVCVCVFISVIHLSINVYFLSFPLLHFIPFLFSYLFPSIPFFLIRIIFSLFFIYFLFIYLFIFFFFTSLCFSTYLPMPFLCPSSSPYHPIFSYISLPPYAISLSISFSLPNFLFRLLPFFFPLPLPLPLSPSPLTLDSCIHHPGVSSFPLKRRGMNQKHTLVHSGSCTSRKQSPRRLISATKCLSGEGGKVMH